MGIQITCNAGVNLTIHTEVSGDTSPATMRIQIEDNNDPTDPSDLVDDGNKVVSTLDCNIKGTALVALTPFDTLINWRPVGLAGGTASLFVIVSQNGAPLTQGLDDSGNALVFDGRGKFVARAGIAIGAGDLCGLLLAPV